MKKIIWAMLFASALFVSCGDDDDDSNSSDSNNKKENVSDDTKVTKDNCLPALKNNYGLDLQLPSTCTVTSFNSFTYDWAVNIKSDNAKEDASTILKSLFDQSKKLSSEGLFHGTYEFNEVEYEMAFVKGEDINSLEDAIFSEIQGYTQYHWYYKNSRGAIVEVFMDCDEDKGAIGIGVD